MRHELGILLRGAPEDLRRWINDPGMKSLRLCLVTIILAFGIYGMTLGFWRDPKMGLFVGIKMPALILLTLICNGFLNGMLGLLLGSGLGFRQSIMAQLMSFTIAALVLGGLAPVTFFMSLNAPAPDADNAANAHSYFLVTHTRSHRISRNHCKPTPRQTLGRSHSRCPHRHSNINSLAGGECFCGSSTLMDHETIFWYSHQ